MKISMLMPTYNCPPALLETAIRSVMTQTHGDWEIVMKDGCVDHPAVDDPELSDLFLKLGSRFVYDLSPDGRDDKHSGFYPALNWCAIHATGDVFSYLGCDDERGDTSVLESVNAFFERETQGPALLYGSVEWINEDGSHQSFREPEFIPVVFEDLKNANLLFTPSVFWNRAVFEKFGLFNEDYEWAADYDYWLRIWRGTRTAYTPRVIGKYRNWSTSQCMKNEVATTAQSEQIKGLYR